jgi:hypothetical protein
MAVARDAPPSDSAGMTDHTAPQPAPAVAAQDGRDTRAVRPALGLFVLAPLVGEYLLGNVSISALGYLLLFAPLYGAGALLVREITRRAGPGWPTMILLGLAYAIIEEGLLTQSLFNPSYGGFDLLATAHVEVLGMGAWWTLFVLTLHTVWSTGVSIALAEALAGRRRTTPWLGRVGLAVTATVFVVGGAGVAYGSRVEDDFVASPQQLLGAAAAVAVVAAAAFAVGRREAPALDRAAPDPWLVGLTALAASSVFMGATFLLPEPGSAVDWVIVGLYLALYAVTIALVRGWSARRPEVVGERAAWDDRHRLALAGGALLTYAWFGWPAQPVVGVTGSIDLIGNAVFSLGAIVLLLVAAARVRAQPRVS